MKHKWKVESTSQTGQSLLVSEELRPDTVVPMVSIQLPTEVATELARCANKSDELIAVLKTIQNKCDAPHWTVDRRWDIRELARAAWTNF